MDLLDAKMDIIRQLQKEVISLQSASRPSDIRPVDTGLSSIEKAFPGHVFPTGVVHEFISRASEDSAATNGFIAGLLGLLMRKSGVCLWISTGRTIFPPALKVFGIEPDRVIFIDLNRQKEALWAIEEALKCNVLVAVVGELRELGFTESRRLQLAVELSHVTGLIHRYSAKSENTVACVTRWKIGPLPSFMEEGMPGIGYPRWNVQLVKVRNGRPGTWQIEWVANSFRQVTKQTLSISQIHTSKAG
jgi:protein ImuA